MEISVIVPTYNRNQQILNLLNSLERQSYQKFEVILVNDGSTDDTLNILHNYKRDTALKLKIIDSDNKGRSGSRNLGVKHAAGDLLIFLDDDVRANEKCLELHLSFHMNYENAILGGPYLYDTAKFTHDFSFFRKHMEDQWYPREKGFLESASLRINGGNFSVIRNLFWKVDGFDERLTDKEDFILSYQLNRHLQTQVYFSNDVWVYHDDFRGLKDYIRRGVESRRVELKLPIFYKKIKLDSTRFFSKLMFPKSLFFRLFRTDSMLTFCDSSRVFLLLPRWMRYKLYDFIITANIAYGGFDK